MPMRDQLGPEWASLSVPSLARSAIRRHGLLETLCDARARVIWITTPAGYGKTTLLAQHADLMKARGERISWLTLEQSDADARRLGAHLCLALSAGNDAPPAQTWHASEPESLLMEALGALSAMQERLTLYLDNCQLAAGAGSCALLAALLHRAPESLRIVAAAQGIPPIALVDLELQGLLRRLNEADLRFSTAEAQSFLDTDAASAAILAAVIERSQGWPIALQLARNQLARSGAGAFELEALSGADTTLGRYFTEVVLSRLPAGLKEFLTDTAVLERVNGDVADAIRERSDSWSLLEEAEARGMFLTPCDADGEWFQYHPMFREFLAHRGRRADAQREKALRRRASLWLARHEAWPEAIQQAMRSGDIDLAAQIVDRTNHLEVMMRFGSAVLGGLDQLPDEHLARYPRLALCVAYAHFQEGRLPRVRRLLEAIPPPAPAASDSGDRTEETQRNVFEALMDMCGDQQCSGRMERIETCLLRGEVDSPLVRGQCYVVLTVHRQNQDDASGALLLSDRLMQEMQRVHAPYLDGFGWILRGMAHMARAELGAAQQCYKQCLSRSEKYFGRTAIHTPVAEIALAETLYEMDRVSEAAIPLEQGLTRFDSIYGWYDLWEPAIVTAPPVLAHVYGLERALTFLHQSQASAQTRGLERAHRLCDAARISLLVQAGQVGEAAGIFERSQLPVMLGSALEIGTSRVFTYALLAAHDIAVAQGDAQRWADVMAVHIDYLRQRGLRRRLLMMLLARACGAEQLGDAAAACGSFREALLIGASRGFVRVFLERARQLAGTAARVAGEPFDPSSQAELRTMLASMRERSGVLAAPAGSALLSPREAQVLEMMPEGFTSKEIARRLGVTQNTVKGYRRTLFEKLGVTSRSQAIEKARRLRLLP